MLSVWVRSCDSPLACSKAARRTTTTMGSLLSFLPVRLLIGYMPPSRSASLCDVTSRLSIRTFRRSAPLTPSTFENSSVAKGNPAETLAAHQDIALVLWISGVVALVSFVEIFPLCVMEGITFVTIDSQTTRAYPQSNWHCGTHRQICP